MDSNFVENYKKSYLFNKSLLGKKDITPPKLYPDADGIDLDIFKKLAEIESNITEFVEKGRNLFLYSNVTGNGKTEWSKKLLVAWFNAIWYETELKPRGLFIDVQKLFYSMRDSISGHNEYYEFVKQYIKEVDLVVWDEIGVRAVSEWEHSQFLMFINERLDSGKSNIFTSNIFGDQLKEIIGDRIYSRAVQNSKIFEFKGKDKRAINSNW